MATTGFAARTQRRKNLELSMLRRPSDTASIPSQYSATTAGPPSISDRQDPSPSSPHSSVSTSGSSVVIENYDKFHALQLQLQKNTAQIELNEARMKQIEIDDTSMAEDIQSKLTAVMELNQRLSLLRAMLARADKVSQGHFGL